MDVTKQLKQEQEKLAQQGILVQKYQGDIKSRQEQMEQLKAEAMNRLKDIDEKSQTIVAEINSFGEKLRVAATRELELKGVVNYLTEMSK